MLVTFHFILLQFIGVYNRDWQQEAGWSLFSVIYYEDSNNVILIVVVEFKTRRNGVLAEKT